ncbi:MAG: 5-oxoprolinase subunit PxpA [Bacteroidota bacterium]
MKIDINCDMGESFGQYRVGNDDAIFPYITSSNIACGFHGGDPVHIEKTINSAIEHGVQIGAHPSYPDLGGFGRRFMQVKKSELKSILKYQIAAIKGLVECKGAKLIYVKPHGALYNQAARDEAETTVIIEALQEIDPTLILMGLAGSTTERVCKKRDITFVAEAFADRKYEPDGSLRSRLKPGAVIHDPEEAAAQVLSIVKEKKVLAHGGLEIPIVAQSICIHGDNPTAIDILKKIEVALAENNILKKGFAK